MASNVDPYLLVAAIDFGTTFSGYAFSFVSSEKDPSRHEKIRINKSWGASMGFQSYKAPTSVLTTKSGEFLEFGYEAEQTYTQALEYDDSDDESDGTSPDMLLFRHFKMSYMDFARVVKLDSTISAVDGTIHKAVDIFAHALRFLKNHMLKAIKLESGCLPNDEEVRWVITVPAIWGDASKQFMREAAHLAGCIKERSSKKLIIALEPEAASMCCRNLSLAQYEDDSGVGFPMGTKYLVLDCGGGTVDITAHKVKFDRQIEEIMEASGGPWGGTAVDRKFKEFLEKALGKNFLNTYIKKCPNEWLSFLTTFEKAKKAFTSASTSKINIAIPLAMGTMFASMNGGKAITKALKEIQGIKCPSGMLSIQHDVANSFFQETITEIVTHLDKLEQTFNFDRLNYILMVGGFSDCHVLQEAIATAYKKNGIKVLVPGEAQMAIIKGAVLYGHNPQSITMRMLRRTYGTGCSKTFDAKIHDEAKRFRNCEGQERCMSVFCAIARKGSQVETGEKKKTKYDSLKNQSMLCINIYSYEDKVDVNRVMYVDETGFTNLGQVKISVDNKDKKENDQFEVALCFGNTEILVEAENLTTGEKTNTTIDFL